MCVLERDVNLGLGISLSSANSPPLSSRVGDQVLKGREGLKGENVSFSKWAICSTGWWEWFQNIEHYTLKLLISNYNLILKQLCYILASPNSH